MKKIFCIIAFSFSCSLLTLENPNASLNSLMELEPPYPLKPREVNIIVKVIDFCFFPNGGFYEAVTQPFFGALYFSAKRATKGSQKQLLKQSWIIYKESLSKI